MVPTLFEWMGGQPRLDALTKDFYARVAADPLVGPLFARMGAEHPAHVAAFVAEVFGGPRRYSEELGGHPAMIRHHLGKRLTEAQRRRWMALLVEAADAVGVPDDPEFRSAFVGYVEWGTRLAVLNSQEGAVVNEDAPMPSWGWGEAKGPYVG